MGFNFKKGGNFLFALLLSTCIFFVHVEITEGAPVFNSTFPVFAPTSTLGSIRQIREDMSDGKIYITGSSVSRIIGVSADHSSAYAIDYSASQPASTGSDFVVYGGTIFMITNAGANGGIYRYDISGSTANLIASVSPSAGTGSITFADNGSIYINRSSGVVKYDNNLSKLTPTSSIPFAATKMAYNGGKLFYLSSTGRVVQSLLDGADTIISNSGPTSAPKGLAISNDGSAIYFANGTGGTVKKILASNGTLLWTATLSGLAGMDINTSTGKILLINTSGGISSYDPINTPTSLTATASSSNAILSWTSGVSDSDFKGATIRRSTATFPSSPSDGDAVTSSYNNTTFSDTGLSDGTYYYGNYIHYYPNQGNRC